MDSQTPLLLDEDEDTAGASGSATRSSSTPESAIAAQDDLPDTFGRPALLVGNLAVRGRPESVEAIDKRGPDARVREDDGTAAPRASSPEEPIDPEAREGSAEPSHSLASSTFLRGGAVEPRVVLDKEEAIARAGVREGEGDLHRLVPTSLTQPEFMDSGSPSASQIYPVASQEGSDADEARSNASFTYVRDAKRAFAEQNAARSAGEDARGVQMVLSTRGASWNLRQQSADTGPESARPSKRRKAGESEVRREGVAARQELRSTLRDFARPGSQIVDETVDEDDAEDVSMHEIHDASLDEDGEPDIDTDNRLPSHAVLELPKTAVSPARAEDGLSPSHGEAYAEAEKVIDLRGTEGDGTPSCADPDGDATPNVSTISGTSPGVSRPEVIRTTEEDEAVLGCDLPRISQIWRRLEHKTSPLHGDVLKPPSGGVNEAIKDAGISNVEDDDRATEALARVIDKSDFRSMDIVGQFNLGFIIGRRRKLDTPPPTDTASCGTLDDLFIIDQHAADEKYNFESLQETTKIESQRLFQ